MSRLVSSVFLLAAALSAGGCQTTGTAGNAEAPATAAFDERMEETGGVPEPVVSIKPGERPPLNSDEAGWWMMMDNVEEKARTAGNLVSDPGLNAYVSDVVCRVAGPHCDDIRVYIVRVPHFNASMAPNGMMQIWTGLILRARNEAQLAAVVGHEIGHYLRRHTLQRMRSVVSTYDFMAFFQIGLAVVGIPGLGDLAHLLAVGALQAHSRDDEREADRIGLELMTKAGYDPREAARIWEYVQKEKEADPDAETPSIFFASHPPSEERRDTLAELAEHRIGKGPSGETGRERFIAETSRLRGRLLRDEMHVRNHERAEYLVSSLLEDGHRQGELHFYKGEIYRLRADEEKKDLERAITEYEKAIAAGDCPPMVYRSLGLVYGRQKKPDKARDAYRQYLERAPNAPDRQFVERMLAPTS